MEKEWKKMTWEDIKELTDEELRHEMVNSGGYTEEELENRTRDDLLELAQISKPLEETLHWLPKYTEMLAFCLIITSIIILFSKQWAKSLILLIIGCILYPVAFLINRKIIIKRLHKKLDI